MTAFEGKADVMPTRRMKSSRMSAAPLAGRVAVVAGATRGAGRGIARGLAEAGAIVYCTGRSVRGTLSPYGRPETIAAAGWYRKLSRIRRKLYASPCTTVACG